MIYFKVQNILIKKNKKNNNYYTSIRNEIKLENCKFQGGGNLMEYFCI